MKDSDRSHRTTPSAGSTYLVVGFAGLALIGVHVLQGPAQRWALAPVLVGACGLVFYWRLAPLVVLVAVAFAKVWPMVRFGDLGFRPTSTLLSDVVLCGATLTYIVAHYRLISLRVAILPTDARNGSIARDPAAVPAREAVTSIFAVVAVTVAAFFLWQLTFLVRPPWMIVRAHWRVGLLVWIVAIGLTAIVAAIGYVGWRRQSRTEAMLVLRDEFWRQTRGEQRRINRWTAWASRRRERAGEAIE